MGWHWRNWPSSVSLKASLPLLEQSDARSSRDKGFAEHYEFQRLDQGLAIHRRRAKPIQACLKGRHYGRGFHVIGQENHSSG